MNDATLAARRRDEHGFTLIELLVVIIIIGILAAIAIPVLMNQRKKSYDAQAKEDLHNMAVKEEIYFTDYSTYATASSQLDNFHQSSAVVDSVVGTNTTQSYCLKSVSQSGTTWYFGSLSGSVGTTPCTTG